jgi:hypothetical protein
LIEEEKMKVDQRQEERRDCFVDPVVLLAMTDEE